MKGCLIAIAGPSGSGKSLFAQTLCDEVRRDAPELALALLREDAYYRDQSSLPLAERAAVNYDHPQRIEPAPIIIVEGILLLTHPELRAAFDIRFFMDTPLDICLLRRIDRDVRERGRSLESVLEQYQSTVRPMYQEFIAPSARHADMVITRGGRNRVALDFVRGHLIGLQRAMAG